MAYTHEPTDPRVRRHSETMARHGWLAYQVGLAAEGEAAVGRLNGVVLVRRRRPRYRGGKLVRYALAYVGFLVWARRMVGRLARERRVRVVQVNNIPNFMVFAAGPARRAGAGVILDLHDPVPELFLSKFGRRAGAGLAARLLVLEERVAARYADLVLCVHDHHREVTESHGVDGRRLRVVFNSPDDRLFPLGVPRSPGPFLAYHGVVASRIGLDVVLRAIRLLRDRGLPVSGAVWGDGDAVESLRRIRDELGLQEVVELTGRRFRLEALLPKLAQVGVGVVPVARDQFTDIQLPTKLLEYVRLGIPVVTVWNPTTGRYFQGDTVCFVREFTPAAVASAVEAVLAAPEQARERAARAQRLPIARSWQEFESGFVDIVQGVGGIGQRS